MKKYINLFLILSFFKIIHPHGFSGNTIVQESLKAYWQIDNIFDYVADGPNLYVMSYDELNEKYIQKKINSAGFCQSKYHCRIFFNDDANPLLCTPLQLFYKVKDHTWIAAFNLKAGDCLLCGDNKTVKVSSVELLHENLKVYTLEIKGTHTFLVSKHNIVAHNMLIPLGAAGLAIPFDIGCGASVGSALGPAGICAGIVIGGLIGCIVNACIKQRVIEYDLSFNSHELACFTENNKEEQNKNTGAQAPGKPTKNDGFIPKKNWNGEKVKHPKTGQVGWPDEKGNVWVPTGIGPLAHRGPHWDVVDKKGKHKNVLPGGKIC